MKKLGFTLAEVLITLAVVGVISALTLPSLSKNITKQQVGPALSKAIHSLQDANRMILQKNGTGDLFSICDSNLSYVTECLAQALNGTTSLTSNVYYKQYSGNGNFHDFNGYYQFTTDDGVTFHPTSTGNMANAPKKYVGRYYELYVDVNGVAKTPNRLGHDLFKLCVDGGGEVIPYGSEKYSHYTGVTDLNATAYWETRCLKGKVTDATTCAGSVVDNGFKVVY